MRLLIACAAALITFPTLGGAWGLGPFENDDAADWLFDLQEADASFVVQALKVPLKRGGYLQAPDCTVAIAAAEIVAAAAGKPTEALPEDAQNWLKANNNAQLTASTKLATKATRACLSPDNSELRQLWSEDQDTEKLWLDEMNELLKRLGERPE